MHLCVSLSELIRAKALASVSTSVFLLMFIRTSASKLLAIYANLDERE